MHLTPGDRRQRMLEGNEANIYFICGILEYVLGVRGAGVVYTPRTHVLLQSRAWKKVTW